MGPATLVSILREHDPLSAWDLVRRGALRRPSKVSGAQAESLFGSDGGSAEQRQGDRSWESAAARIDVVASWARYEEDGVRVTWFGRDDYPGELLHDPNPPGVLFWRGSLACLERPRVAIVGTRNATPDGRAIAFEMGRDLAAAGVCVVSGLALGIDGAAHHGALDGLGDGPDGAPANGSPANPSPDNRSRANRSRANRSAAPPLGVAASGVDVPYPRQHASLWERVCNAGAVISETPPGQPAQAWRFPMRNRVIAGLSHMVVVVESHMTGGSLITAEAALERGVEVRAVPGPIRSPASEGSNQLLYDGPGPVRSAQDVLDALGLILPAEDACPEVSPEPKTHRGRRGTADGLSSSERAVRDAVGWRPSTIGRIVDRSGIAVGEAAAILDRLEARGLLAREGPWWVRRL
jgi:DNA processing protein